MTSSETSQLDVQISIGVGLIQHATELLRQFGELRQALHDDHFIEMPSVRVTDDLKLSLSDFVIYYNGVTMRGEGVDALLESLEYLMRIFVAVHGLVIDGELN